MDITPIYDLRDRLRTAMIAGTSLLAEDFRLKRAVEAMAPLEKAAPVFAKVGELCRKLIAADAGTDGKEDLLLDAITLVDAVCCTQGAVGVAGEMEPVFAKEELGIENNVSKKKKMVLSNVPHSTLQPLREALTTSGGGRYAYVTDCHKVSPELFKDYRIRVAMVQALGASYAELADDVRNWLLEDGEDVIPLLVRDFNPKGKKEMVRRLHIIDKWMGAAANDFYIKQLETAEGELRQNLIYALRHDPKNIEFLMDLGKKERGNTKKVVYCVLACNDNEEVEKLFEEMYKKKPKTVMEYLEMSPEMNKTAWAARLTAKGLKEWLQSKPEKTGDKKKDDLAMKEWEQTAAHFVDTLYGKSGPEVCAALSKAAAASGKYGSVLQREVLGLLCYWLISQPGEEIFSLVHSIYEGEDGAKGLIQYFPAALIARVISECGTGTENAGTDFVDWLSEQLFDKTPCVPYHFLTEALRYLKFHKGEGYAFEDSCYDNVAEYSREYAQPVRMEIKGKLLELLIRCRDQEIDRRLAELFDPADKEVCSILEEYFYKRALSTPSDEYLVPLKRCGSTRCEELLVHFVKSRPRVSMWQIQYFVQNMPGSREDKIAEAKRIPELAKTGKATIYNWNEKNYMNWVESIL
ncbi:MAG: hypothetical protein K2N63_06670 [Lachnospiraceae bacterium]|nr:hypothetical protein [Lachnospiraceae bacterium]